MSMPSPVWGCSLKVGLQVPSFRTSYKVLNNTKKSGNIIGEKVVRGMLGQVSVEQLFNRCMLGLDLRSRF